MRQHLINLHFESRVNGYEDKIAYIAQRIAERFGDKVDADLPLANKRQLAKLVYLNATNFGEAMRMADDIDSFLKEPEILEGLKQQGIDYALRCPDRDYAAGWRGTFAQRFEFK